MESSLIKEEGIIEEAGINLNANPVSLEDQSAVFYEIVYLPDNQICVDCGKKIINLIFIADAEKGVKYISVNNAVLLCEDCANQHKKLHSGISYVMSIADAGETYSL